MAASLTHHPAVDLFGIPIHPSVLGALGVSLPNTATAQELFNSCVAHGGKAWDHSAMVRALEKLANFEIGQQA